jgi:mannosyltransferase
MSSTDFPAPRFGLPRLREARDARAISPDVVAVIGIVVVAAVLRILTIDNQSIWADEALTAYETHLPFGGMLNVVINYETTPPLYFCLIWGWAKLFGTGAIALRSFSSICGLGLVVAGYVSGRELVSRRAGVLAAAFIAVNPLMIWYSQEARSYMLLALLTAVGFIWWGRTYRELTRRNLLWWTGISCLCVMTHFFAGFILAPEAALLLWRWRRRAIVGAIALIAAVQAAMLPFAVADTTHGTAWIHGIPRITRIWQAIVEWGAGTLYRRVTENQGLIAGAVLLSAVVLLFAFGADREMRRRVRVPAAIVAFVLIAPLLLGLVGPDFFLSRNVIPAFVPLAVLIAAACALPRLRVLGAVLAVALLALFSVATARVQTHAYLQRPRWRDVAHALGPAPVPRLIMAADGTTAQPLKLYLPHVDWVQNQGIPRRIQEVDVIGVRNDFPVRRFAGAPAVGIEPLVVPPRRSWPVPRFVPPEGARLAARFRVDNWVIGRFVFVRPITVSIAQLIAEAPEFFRSTPRSMLVFEQQVGHNPA